MAITGHSQFLKDKISQAVAAARLGQVGDKVIILTFALVSEDEAKKIAPKLVRVDSKNKTIE